MTKGDLYHPRDGERLDFDLFCLVIKHCLLIILGKYGFLHIQLANKGGDVPALCVEPDNRLFRRKPLIRVRYQHSYEGYEIKEKTRTLPSYMIAKLLGQE